MAFPKRSLGSGVLAFAMGSASAQMYYLLVYVQLVLLTPVLFKLLSRNRFLVYATTPVCLLLRELFAFAGIELPQIQVLCPMWLIFYVVGLDWKRWSRFIEGRTVQLAVVSLACLVLQEASGFCWNLVGDFNMATTQLKLSSAATSLAAIAFFMAVSCSCKLRLSSSSLVNLGNASFGVYLCHIIVLVVIRSVLESFTLPLGVFTFVLWALTLAGSYCAVAVIGRLLPERARVLIGF